MANWLSKLFSKNTQSEVLGQVINERLLALSSELIDFYHSHEEMFQSYFEQDGLQKNKNNFIKSIYDEIGYTNSTLQNRPDSKISITLYRGIRAKTEAEVREYAESFAKGEVFFGAKATLYGKGTYMSNNIEIAEKYATYDTSYGAVITCEIDGNAKLIDLHELEQLKTETIDYIKSEYISEQEIQQYVSVLESDNGLFAAIAGYDAISIPEKNYTLVLNRREMFVSNIEYQIERVVVSNLDKFGADSVEKGERFNTDQCHVVEVNEIDEHLIDYVEELELS